MTIKQKIELAAAYAGISKAEVARRAGWTPQNFNQRIDVGKFTLEELEKIGDALGAPYTCSFTFQDGTKF